VSEEDATTVSKVEVKWVEDDLFIGGDEAGHSVVFESALPTPDKPKPRPRGIGPMNALLTSLGACSGMDVAAILLKRKQKLNSLKVEVSGKRPKFGHPKPFTEIHLRYLVGGDAIEEKYVKEAVSDSTTKFCSVAATVSGNAKISYSYEIARA
jgi:putative redox protein